MPTRPLTDLDSELRKNDPAYEAALEDVAPYESLELAVAELPGGLERPPGVRERGVEIRAALERDHAQEPLEVAALDAVGLVGHEALCPRDPGRSDRRSAFRIMVLSQSHRDHGEKLVALPPGVPPQRVARGLEHVRRDIGHVSSC